MPRLKPVLALIAIVVIGAVVFWGIRYYRQSEKARMIAASKPEPVKVEYARLRNNSVYLPSGFPEDIPVESARLTGGATTQYLNGLAKQYTVSYVSAKTPDAKYLEYKNYLTGAGYAVTEEGGASSPVRALFGAKEGSTLSVVISKSEAQTLVQIAYLLTSQ